MGDRSIKYVFFFALALIAFLILLPGFSEEAVCAESQDKSFITRDTIDLTIGSITAKINAGNDLSARIRKGVEQVASRWSEEEGQQAEFTQFCLRYFIAEPGTKQKLLLRCESNLEIINGNFNIISRHLNEPTQLECGPILPVDYLFAEFSPSAHLAEDFFKNKIAFAILLNFPLYSLDEKNRQGLDWSREKWAEAELAERYRERVPAKIVQKVIPAYNGAENYISNYNIYMHNLIAPGEKRLFPEGMKLISHWGLRDEIRAQYNNQNGLECQELIAKVMERIILQEIPEVVINNPDVDWDPISNKVFRKGQESGTKPEQNDRYGHIQNVFRAALLVDPYTHEHPTLISRNFEESMGIPEEEVEAHLLAVMTSPVLKKIAKLVEKRLGRRLKPWDIWYSGFRSAEKHSQQDLDKIVASRYPNADAFRKDIPLILRKLGFSEEKARWLSERIAVDPCRGSGHALGAELRTDKAHLRTRFEKEGMNYKGYNIAIHELGHNVEQVFSLCAIDHTLLQGVPNTAFTEAFAFLFQAQDLKLLGLSEDNPQDEQLAALDTLWMTYEISGVSLVAMRLWHWMYAHSDASKEEIKGATLSIARDIWNEYYAPVIGEKDSLLLAVYSHMIDNDLYLPNYPMGHIIQFQIEQHLKKTALGDEMERMCVLGHLTPEIWMKKAIGASISPIPLIEAGEEALNALGE